MNYRYSNSQSQNTFRATSPLSDDTIARYAPSVFADSAHESRGERYAFIPTSQVLDGLRAEGFQPFEVRQTNVRDASKRSHTKHMVRLRHADAIGSKEETAEIILLNSHDGTSAYKLLAGWFRMVCSNGLIAGDFINDVSVRHTGNVVNNVIEGSYQVLRNIQHSAERIDAYKSIILSPTEAVQFAETALALRWDAEEAPVIGSQLLRLNRYEDRESNLWTVFNRVQENLIQGGLRGRNANGRRTTTRAVRGVSEDVRLNRALWTLADGLAMTKAPALLAA